jgi:hypothetical protein
MTITISSQPTPKRKSRLNLWFEKIMVIFILINYLLVLFDLSYIPYHDFWQQGEIQIVFETPLHQINFPNLPIKVFPFNITPYYDWVKGIKPHRATVQYLNKVDELNNTINQQAQQLEAASSQTNLILTEESEMIFANLRNLSDETLKLNPFEVANKTGTLEIIKNRMRQHIFDNTQTSADAAFDIFWSSEHFKKQGYRQELNFFEQDIKPLMETNYFRPLGENGKPLDYFWLLDFPFITLFFLGFLMRTRIISRHYRGVTWFDAMLWRWYDIFLFLPILRWLRILPLIIRLNHAKFINLKPIKRLASQGFVANIAEDIVQVVVIRVINQVQTSISQGDIQKFLKQRHQNIEINGHNELAEIFKIFLQITVQKVIPQIKPDAEALLKHNFAKALSQTPILQNLQKLPGMKNLENQISEQISFKLYQAFSETLVEMTKDDPKSNELLGQLMQTFNQAMATELQGQKRIDQLETLVTEFLEEFKINYVKPLSAEDLEIILEQTRLLRQTNDLTFFEPTLIRQVRA